LQAEQRERQRLLQWRTGLWQRFQEALAADLAAAGPASRYLQQRGLTADTARHWRLGLHQGRLMLPICDGQGRCCGFSGRSVPRLDAGGRSTEAAPKYRNSRADALFRRQELVFGLVQAAATIRRSGDALLVEGPLDVVQLHQGGFTQAVAALGTSLCPGQRQRLQRAGARRLVIAFDGDPAGVAACGRLIAELRPLAISGALELAVLPLPAGQDPDGLLRQEGAAAFTQRLAAVVHWLQW
jgi:DNA primase